MKKKDFMLLLLAAGVSFYSCGKDDSSSVKPINFGGDTTTNSNVDTTQVKPSPEPPKPDDSKKTIEINENSTLKSFVDRAKYPNYKLSGALDVGEFHNNRNGIRDIVAANFDEIVAGNAMKYASCVNGSGQMNFDRVKTFVEDAKAAGLTIYGHTLAWHSQQQPAYLLSLMKDKTVQDPDAKLVEITDLEQNYKGLSSWNYWHGEFQNADNNVDFSISTEAAGVHIKNNKESKQFYSVQYVIADNIPTEVGGTYDITLRIKASESADITLVVGGWGTNNNGKISVSDSWQDVVFHIDGLKEGSGHVMLQSGNFVGDIWVESLKITHLGSDKKVALTDKEKRDTLAWAMDNWIKGMMEATDGFVTAWDVCNEPLSGGDGDGDGLYDLQNYKNNNNADPTNVSSGVFYWQAFMGDLEYVRTAVASARKHFKGNASDLKLFINDYNLESDWDDNGKVKSMVKWIQRWEADGVTKIDGIGTQMHITCYENPDIQKSMEDHIVKMFQIMAGSGKLVRVSELDMGYKRGNDKWGGKNLTTSQLTAEEHQKMADFYKFIIKKYFEIVPPAQQYGICQWCLTDAPAESGWRGGEPVGIWTEGFKERKVVFNGFAEGHAGVE